jgi:hypothetical protein
VPDRFCACYAARPRCRQNPYSGSATRNPLVLTSDSARSLAFLAIGIIYLAYESGGLPPMFPGRNSGSTDHHLKHGFISFAIAGTVWITAWVASWRPVEPQFAFRGAGL